LIFSAHVGITLKKKLFMQNSRRSGTTIHAIY
jgi:hypothetical protein